eukprot:2891571-Prymnesium_polylepis.1
MAQQQQYYTELRVPQLYRPRRAPLLEHPLVARCLAALRISTGLEVIPPPVGVLDAIAGRWHLPRDAVHSVWREFVEATEGKYTLTMARARDSLLAALPEDMHAKVWAFALMDAAVRQLLEGGEGGAAGLNFEEYLVFRCFVGAKSLEEQFRFLWRLYDRDGDGKLGRADAQAALALRGAQLGWDEQLLQLWVQRLFEVVPHARSDGSIGAPELKAALQKWGWLRLLLLAREP